MSLSAYAARRELGPHLPALGVVPAADGQWCAEIDGRLTVVLAIPTLNQPLAVQQPAPTP